jgi:hypothetical protein
VLADAKISPRWGFDFFLNLVAFHCERTTIGYPEAAIALRSQDGEQKEEG